MPDRPHAALHHNQNAQDSCAPLLCDVCANVAMAVLPGSEPIRELFTLTVGAPRRQWCLEHAPWAQPAPIARVLP